MQTQQKYFAYRSFWPELETVRRFGEAGIDLVTVFPSNSANSLGEPYSKYPPNWLWFDRYDFEPVRRQFDDLLSANPRAEFLVMLDLNSPLWLSRQLNGRNGDSFTNLTEAVSIPRWREAVGGYLDALVDFLEENYGGRIEAYILACGTTDEWMDYSDGGAGREKTAGFQQWCRKRNFPVPADVPSRSLRNRAGFDGTLRDPAHDAEAIRYWRFTSELISETIQSFANQVRTRVSREIRIGVFYGYILELGDNRLVKCGHLAYPELLASGAVDFLISPGTYGNRKMGEGGGFMTPEGTIRRFGRDYLHECDQRTHCFNPNLSSAVKLEFEHWRNEAEDIAGMRREMALSLIKHTSLWWFDMWGGFYQGDAIMNNVKKMKCLWDRFSTDTSPSRAEVALVVDPAGTLLIDDEKRGAGKFHYEVRNRLNRLGAPFDVVSFDDLAELPEFDRYKLLIFASIFELDEERAAFYRTRIAGGDRTILWLYAAGVSDGKTIDPARNRAYTGAEFGAPGCVRTDHGNYKTCYLHDPEKLDDVLIREIAREAGVRLWTEESAPVFANDRLAAFHTATGGERKLTFPETIESVTELYSGKHFTLKDHTLLYRFETPDTALFELCTHNPKETIS